jgi:hypothetical protein
VADLGKTTGPLAHDLARWAPCMSGARGMLGARRVARPARRVLVRGRGVRRQLRAEHPKSDSGPLRSLLGIRTSEPCAHGTWPTEPARRSRARDDGGLPSFYFIYRFSKLRNSKILNATQKSPKSKVVEEL